MASLAKSFATVGAFLQFKSKDAARAALGLDGHVLRGRPLRVTRVKAVAVTAKGKSSAKAAASTGGDIPVQAHDVSPNVMHLM